tara:strand:- start:282 stop:449 length:168 start_codon:yes stop_codon:yes gene_type:complete
MKKLLLLFSLEVHQDFWSKSVSWLASGLLGLISLPGVASSWLTGLGGSCWILEAF